MMPHSDPVERISLSATHHGRYVFAYFFFNLKGLIVNADLVINLSVKFAIRPIKRGVFAKSKRISRKKIKINTRI